MQRPFEGCSACEPAGTSPRILVIFASSQHFTGRPRLLINGLARRNLFGVNVPLTVDRTIIENARSGGAALDCLITIVWPQAYQIALSILRDSGLAEDAA